MGLVTNSIAGLVTNLRADRTDPPSDFNLRSDTHSLTPPTKRFVSAFAMFGCGGQMAAGALSD